MPGGLASVRSLPFIKPTASKPANAPLFRPCCIIIFLSNYNLFHFFTKSFTPCSASPNNPNVIKSPFNQNFTPFCFEENLYTPLLIFLTFFFLFYLILIGCSPYLFHCKIQNIIFSNKSELYGSRSRILNTIFLSTSIPVSWKKSKIRERAEIYFRKF